MHAKSLELVVAACLLLAGACMPARAQCPMGWDTRFSPGSVGTTTAASVFDTGEDISLYVAQGGILLRWDGRLLTEVTQATGQIFALLTHDFDGDGPGRPELVAAGRFSSIGGVVAQNIAAWDGTSWRPLGAGLAPASSTVWALASVDFDGDGPLAPMLFAGGDFLASGAQELSRIAMWSGEAGGMWLPLGTGVTGPVRAMMAYSPPGAESTALLVAGGFAAAGGIPTSNLAIWDGQAWAAFASGTGPSGPVHAVCTFDPDGPGPLPERLVVGGDFSAANGVSAPLVAQWDGAAWSAMPGISRYPFGPSAVSVLLVHDEDGDGPAPPMLFAGGDGVIIRQTWRHLGRWDGTQWTIPGSIGLDRNQSAAVATLTSFDEDGEGPNPPVLVVGGRFNRADGMDSRNLARWNGSQWRGVGRGVAPVGYALVVHDPDGDGPLPEELLVGGCTGAGGLPAPGLARWNTADWTATTPPLGIDVNQIIEFDEDGDGPLPPTIFGIGSFTLDYYFAVARWTESGWAPVYPTGIGLYGQGTAAAVVDFDGAGPQPPRLVVATTDGPPITPSGIYVLNSNGWGNLGLLSGGDRIQAITGFDYDGPGWLWPSLIVAGNFSSISGVPANSIARLEGGEWRSLGTGLTDANGVRAWGHTLAVYDQDGPGPALPQLYVGGTFHRAHTLTTGPLARWGLNGWSSVPGFPIPAPGQGSVSALGHWDPDGPGPERERLVVAGNFSAFGATRLALWNGQQWSTLGNGPLSPQRIQSWDEDGPGGLPPALYFSGGFTSADGVPSDRIARYGPAWPITVTRPPSSVTTTEGRLVRLRIAVEVPFGEYQIQWRRDGVAVVDGPGGASPGGGLVAGSGADRLEISGARISDTGLYDAVIANACGMIHSQAALITVTARPCPADWNADEAVNSADVSAFLSDWLVDIQSGTSLADFTADGQVNSTDISAFISAWLAAVQHGGC